jgi:phosphatidylglycerophosphate synthase
LKKKVCKEWETKSANLLTLSRLPVMFAVVPLLYADLGWADSLAFWLIVIASLVNWLTGIRARVSGKVSKFGRLIDSVVNKVFFIGVMIALVNGNNFLGNNIVAQLLLLCIVCREFAVSGLRMAAAVKGRIIESSAGGRVRVFIQVNAVGWIVGSRMLPLDFPDLFRGSQGAQWIAAVRMIGIGLFVLSSVLTLTSGFSYFRRNSDVLLA